MSYICYVNNDKQTHNDMTINFDLRFNISSTVFVANRDRNNLSFDHADNFIGDVFGNLDQVTPDDVERFVQNNVEDALQVSVAERIMNHLLMCHNVTVEEADRRFC